MKVRVVVIASLISISTFAPFSSRAKTNQSGSPSEQKPARDEQLWKRAVAIHRKAIVIDSHNDITTPMTNDDYDLGGPPPVPYRTSLDRMKEGDRKSTRLNSSHVALSRMPSSA